MAYNKGVMSVRRVESILFAILLAAVFTYGSLVQKQVQQALTIWWNILLPGMLVPMIWIRFIHARHGFDALSLKWFNRLFHLSHNGFAYVICALLLGFPGGAMFLDEACGKRQLDNVGARRLIVCCCFATPGFVILSLGASLYGSLTIGWKLYLIQLASGLLLLFFTRHTPVCITPRTTKPPAYFFALSTAIRQSGMAMFWIGAYLLLFLSLFAILSQLLPSFLALPFQLLGEFSSGCLQLAQSACSPRLQLIATCGLLGFGGLCVHLQILSSLRHVALSYRTFLCFRLLQAAIAMLLGWLLF